MVRTIVSLDPADKSWLDRKAAETGRPMTEVVREAIRSMREREQGSFRKLLVNTGGTWRKGDGLAYQRRVRRGWR